MSEEFENTINQEQDQTIEQDIKQASKKRRRGLFIFWLILILIIAVGGSILFKTGRTFNEISLSNQEWEEAKKILPQTNHLSEKDPNRLNILLLGLRGQNDPEGGLLTDSLMIASIKKDTNQIALISIPRDLYVEIPNYSTKQKINFAYALGEQKNRGSGGLVYASYVVSQVSGLYIDYVAAVNFNAFEEVVDSLGGIIIYREQPFSEAFQWLWEGREDNPFWCKTASSTWEFYVPAGKNHLDGEAALYYVRSRFSTNDFDRMRRQQQTLQAIKDKAFSLGVLANPVKIFNTLDSISRNIRTNLTLGEIKNLIGLAKNLDTNNIKSLVFDTSADGPFYDTKSEQGAYIILPRDGEFDRVHQMCQEIFDH